MGVLPTDAVQFAKTLLNRDKTSISMREVGKLSFVASVCPSASASVEVSSALMKKAKARLRPMRQFRCRSYMVLRDTPTHQSIGRWQYHHCSPRVAPQHSLRCVS